METAVTENIEMAIRDIIGVYIDDAMLFVWDRIEVLNQPHMEYDGFRIFVDVIFGNMKDKNQIDIGIGDIVEPQPRIFYPYEYKGKPIFAGEISLLVYPPENIFAEKLESIVSRGALNSRMKDYHDVLLMLREKDLLDTKKLKTAIHNTFTQRGTTLQYPIEIDEFGMQKLQQLWTAHLRGLGAYKDKLNIPDNINALVKEVANWLSPRNILNESGDAH